MKFSYHWLRELVDGLHTNPEDLMRLITLKTAECEGVEIAGEPLAKAHLARVIATDGKKARVDVGGKEISLLCGAPNLRAGMSSVWLDIGVKTIDGFESNGMLASASELGIGKDHSGIVDLGAWKFDLKPDHIIEVDNKSLTHRPDLWGHHGMAREVAAITGNRLLDPVPAHALSGAPAIEVDVREPVLCPRYSALVFENVTVKPSPLWLQYRLESIGLNTINNIVDVTNFVLAELTQPMHAFDAHKLRGGIIVRTAREAEHFEALNGESYTLDPSNLVIADQEGAIALAGVIGGGPSAISESTTRIVLESACFNAASVRKTSSKLKLRTDASMRFEKSQDPVNTLRGLRRAVALLEEVSPGIRLVGGVTDVYTPLPAPAPIDLPLDWVDRKIGAVVPADQVRKILESLEFVVENNNAEQTGPRVFRVTVPSWRATKDVTIKDDLVEEIGRMIGYDNIDPKAPLAPARVPPENPEREFHHRVREMAAAQGFTEVYNYSFLSEEQLRVFGLEPTGLVEVLNPIVADHKFLRPSLLPGIVKNIRDNAKNFDSFRLFEIGREIHKDHETPHLVAAIFAKDDGKAGLLELKRLAECIVPGIRIDPFPARSFEHPQRSAHLLMKPNIIEVGRLFEFHPNLVEGGRAAVLDLSLGEIFAHERTPVRYSSLRRFPTSAFDVTIAAPARTTIGQVQDAIPPRPKILSIEFLREFALPDGRRSLSYRITAGASDRTLSSEETGAIRAGILEALTARGYESRS